MACQETNIDTLINDIILAVEDDSIHSVVLDAFSERDLVAQLQVVPYD